MHVLLAAFTAAQVATGVPVRPEERPRYRENVDYQLPMGRETIQWATFMLDHDKWPLRTEVAVSKYGAVLVLKWISQTKARFVPMGLMPHEVAAFFMLMEDQVKLEAVRSTSRWKDEPYYLYATAGYARPSRSEAAMVVYRSGAEKVEPLVARLREIAQVASDRTVRHVPLLETEDTEFLNHYMVTWHINETRILVKEEGNKWAAELLLG